MYKVVKDFTDKNDNHVYVTGDIYPRDGVVASEERVAELASTDNIRGEILIKAVDAPKTAKIAAVKEKTAVADTKAGKAKKTPKNTNKKEK